MASTGFRKALDEFDFTHARTQLLPRLLVGNESRRRSVLDAIRHFGERRTSIFYVHFRDVQGGRRVTSPSASWVMETAIPVETIRTLKDRSASAAS